MTPLLFLKCLSDDTRLKCVLLIYAFTEACVCELMDTLALDQPKISRHLAMLRKCNILQDERRGKWVYYRLHPSLPDFARRIIHAAAEGDSTFQVLSNQFKQCQLSNASCCND